QLELALQPRAAGADLAGAGLLVQPQLAALQEFEVLHRVGDVVAHPRDAGVLERAVEELARGADEGLAGEILAVAGLLADEHDPRLRRALAEHGLRRVAP